MRESTLSKIGAFSLNPRLKLMLGQRANHLDFRVIMDGRKVLLLDLGSSDGETNRGLRRDHFQFLQVVDNGPLVVRMGG